MRRRKPTQTAQVNVRLDIGLLHLLETRARENRTTFSEQIRTMLVDGLDPKPEPSLADFRADWLRRLRDTIEHGARKDIEAAKNIESAWRVLQRLDANFAKFYTEVENELSSYLPDPRVRELLRGAPTLPAKARQE
jgi:hypothetical protein